MANKLKKEIKTIEDCISNKTEEITTGYISNGEIWNAYTMTFAGYYNGLVRNDDCKTSRADTLLPINLLSPASLFFQDLVNAKISLLFTKLPEFKSSNQDIENFLNDNKKKFEDFFFNAIQKYALYGNIACYLDEDGELRLITNNYKIAKNFLILTGRKLAEESKKLLLEQGVEADENVYEVFTGGQRLIRIKEKDYLEPINNFTNAGMSLRDFAFINYLWEKFVLLEELHLKIHRITKSIKHYAVTNQGSREQVEEIEDFKVIEVNSEISATGDPMRLLAYNDNSPITATLQALELQKVTLEQEITKLAKLDLVMTIDKENPSETRIAASNRVQLSSNYWRQQQTKVNNFIESCIQAVLLQHDIAPVEDVMKLNLNSISILEEEAREQKRINDIQQISSLVMQAGQLPPGAAELNYLMAKEIASASSISEEVKNALNKMVVSQEQAKLQASQQQAQPSIEDLEKQKVVSETVKNNSQAKKAEVEAELLPKKIEVQATDEEQQLMDANTRALRQQEKRGVGTWLKNKLKR